MKKIIGILVMVSVLIFTGCDEDNDVSVESTGSVRVEATDAAVDNSNITGVFLNVTEIEFLAEGDVRNSLVLETPQEFNLMAFQNGNTFVLGERELLIGDYNEVRLILAESNGAFVTFADNTRQEINVPSGASSGYKVKGNFEVVSNGFSAIVIDVDLRKALVQRGNGEFNLRPTARLISREETGTIEGSIDMSESGNTDRVVIYAYVDGTYSPSEDDTPADGESRFENSVNSAIVDAEGNFTLAFMPEGDYELIAAKFEESTDGMNFEFQSATSTSLLIGGSLLDEVSVDANTTTNLSIDLF